MPRIAFVVVGFMAILTVAPAGCSWWPWGEGDNGLSCQLPENAGRAPCTDGSSGGSCENSTECMDKANFPACETMPGPYLHMCVQCTTGATGEHALCTGTTPVCKNDTCASCTSGDDCGAGGLCLPNGACAVSRSIIYASPGGSPTTPCGDTTNTACSFTTALTAVTPTRNVIKLDNMNTATYTPPASAPAYTVSADVTIDARGAILHHNGDNPILSISSNTTATLFGGTIEGATGANNADGILCGTNATLTIDGTTITMSDRSGINATNGCKLTVTNALIGTNSHRSGVFVAGITASGSAVMLSRSKLLSNTGGGISVTNGTFVIVGNVFFDNGDINNSTNGGVLISASPDPMNRMEFNSIFGNHAQAGNAPGVICSAGAGYIARNNIIWGNDGTPGVQIGGSCKHAYSDVGMTLLGGIYDGGNNLSVDPMFTTMSDFHLMPNSGVLKRADLNANLAGVAAKDIDGDARIAPADIGADQLPRP